MAMSRAEALKKAQDTLEASETVRLSYEAICGLNLAYAYGSQWATLRPGRAGGQNLQQLRTITSANRTDVRFAMNEIGARIVKIDSRLKLKKLSSKAQPATRSLDDQIIALVADARLKSQLRSANAKRILRRASLWRLVMGSVVVRRSISAHGDAVKVFDQDGKQSVNPKTGAKRRLRKFRHSWAVCAPYEFIRDPSARTLDFDDEDIIGHEKPRTTEWLMRKYGVQVKTETTMGQLLEFQRFLYRSTGNSMNNGFSMSEAKAVMVSEWLIKDPSGRDEWDTWMLAYRDTRGATKEDKKLQVIDFGPNPYSGLPFHHFWYNAAIERPWGQGVPELLIQVQDATNIAYSMAIRAMIAHSSPKWVVENDSLVDKIEDALSNRTDVPVVYKRNSTAPTRLPPAQISSEVQHILGQASGWFDRLLNMSPIQQGIGSPRGEAGSALAIKRDSADTPLTAVTDEDEITVNELLTGTLYDISKTDSIKTISDDLNGQFDARQIALFKSKDARKSISGVKVEPDSLRPRTPDEMRSDAAANVQAMMIPAETARRALLIKADIVLDVKEGRAYKRQMAENQTLLDGGEVEVYLGQDHDTHMYTISLDQESAEYPSYTDEQKGALQGHWFEHMEMKGVMQRIIAESAQPPQEGQPGPGQEEQGMLPAPQPEQQGLGGFEGLGGLEQEAPFADPLGVPGQQGPGIAGSIGPGAGIETPGAGQALGIG